MSVPLKVIYLHFRPFDKTLLEQNAVNTPATQRYIDKSVVRSGIHCSRTLAQNIEMVLTNTQNTDMMMVGIFPIDYISILAPNRYFGCSLELP